MNFKPSSSRTQNSPSFSFLCFKIIFLRSWNGDGKWVSFLSTGCTISISPNTSRKALAIFLCCGSEQLSSIDKITGYLKNNFVFKNYAGNLICYYTLKWQKHAPWLSWLHLRIWFWRSVCGRGRWTAFHPDRPNSPTRCNGNPFEGTARKFLVTTHSKTGPQ